MANTITAKKSDYSRRRKTARLAIQTTGNYVNGTGEVLDFTNILNPTWQPNIGFGSVPAPEDFAVTKLAAGFGAEVLPTNIAGATLANAYALRIYSAPGQEMASGAYSAAQLADFFMVEVNTTTFGN